MESKSERKSELRQRMRTLRRTLSAPDPGRMVDLFQAAFPDLSGMIVAGYVAMDGELDPLPLMEAAARQGADLALPCVVAKDKALVFRNYVLGDGLESGAHDTLHPSADKPIRQPDLILVPLVAVDASGHRLGFGGGYYDRTLGAYQAVTVGLAHTGQLVDSVPHEAHDQPLDFVLTPEQLIDCKAG